MTVDPGHHYTFFRRFRPDSVSEKLADHHDP